MKDTPFTADRLLALYDRVAEAEDAIPRLRRFVLDLAVRGKLVEQDPNDEPAAELLKRIAKEKARRVKAGEVGPQKPTTSPDPDDLPFALPSGWAWAQLSTVGIVSPRVRAEDAAEVSFVPMSMIATELGVPHTHEVRVWRDVKKGYTTFAEGDAALAKITPCFENGKSTVFRKLTGGLGAGTTELHVVRPVLTDPDFILLFLKSPVFIERGIPRMTGTAGQKRVPTEYFAASAFPLPPLAEQQRIVAKVEELMALCDRLEAARAGREGVRDRLTAATWARLTAPETDAETLPAEVGTGSAPGDATTKSTFPTHARAALQSLPTLTARPDQIKTLRQTILNLAVRGKLVEQDPTDEPAAELLKRIAKEKARQGVKRPPEGYEATELPFALPVGWALSSIREVCSKTGSGSTPRGGKEVYSDNGIPFLRSQNVYDDGLRLDDVALISAEIHERMSGTAVRPADLLLNITGGSMGRCCRIPNDFAEANVSQHVAIIRAAIPGMADFLHRLVLSPYFQAFIFGEQTGAGRGGLPKNRMDRIAVALPPLAEQHRIVAKVDALITLCDQLESSLTTATTTRSRLLESLLHQALGDQGGMAA